MTDDQLNQVIERLDRLSYLIAASNVRNMMTAEKIVYLYTAGFNVQEIARITGTTPRVISVRLSEIRKKGGIKNEKTR